MLKVFSATIIIVLFLLSLVYLFGYRAGPEINATLFVKFDFGQEHLFDMATDISDYPFRKKNIDTVEVLEKKGKIIIRWKENYKRGVWREYEIISKNSPNIFSYKMTASSDAHTGTITYEFREKNGFTEIILTEEGRIDNVFNRGLHALAGEASFLEKQAKWLRVALMDELINRP